MRKSKDDLFFGDAANKSVWACLQQISNLPKVAKVVVYGSYAKGTNRDDSDVDVAVFFDLPDEDMLTCYRELVRICRISECDIQVQAFSINELTAPCGIVEEIVTYGIEV